MNKNGKKRSESKSFISKIMLIRFLCLVILFVNGLSAHGQGSSYTGRDLVVYNNTNATLRLSNVSYGNKHRVVLPLSRSVLKDFLNRGENEIDIITMHIDSIKKLTKTYWVSGEARKVHQVTIMARDFGKTAIFDPPSRDGLPNISGIWKANVNNLVYQVDQEKDTFTWRLDRFNEKGSGWFTSRIEIEAKWSGGQGTGEETGTVHLDAAGQAVKISWDNGYTWIRPQQQGNWPDISGTWKASINNLVYSVEQNQDTFTWTMGKFNETATGRFMSKNSITVHWEGGQGKGSATGTLILDAANRVISIRWNNGVNWHR